MKPKYNLLDEYVGSDGKTLKYYIPSKEYYLPSELDPLKRFEDPDRNYSAEDDLVFEDDIPEAMYDLRAEYINKKREKVGWYNVDTLGSWLIIIPVEDFMGQQYENELFDYYEVQIIYIKKAKK